MYQKHFGLKELPFSIAPNPRYLYLTHQHQEALAHLIYGIHGEGGIILLTGEVGTGKTTISRKLLEDIPKNIEIAWIVNPRLSVEELLATICDELSITYPDGVSSIKNFTDLISTYLIDAHGHGRNVVLMIDEAQNLSAEVLEQLRLLTNLETSERKLLQIMLFGQPELKQMLERTDLRQLAQRITARYHLQPLSRVDTGEYIRHRLAVGGCDKPVFSQNAIRLIYHFSNGTPRLINLLCDRAMLGIYSRNIDIVKPVHVRQASREVLGETETPKRSFLIPVTVIILLLIVGTLLATGIWQELPDQFKQVMATGSNPSEASNQTDGIPETAILQTATPEPSKDTTPELENQGHSLSGAETKHSETLLPANITFHTTETIQAPKPEPAPKISDPWQEIELAGRQELAFHSLANIWGIHLPSGKTDKACEYFEKHGLKCLRQRGDIGTLRGLNRPAIIRLASEGESSIYACITGLGLNSVTLQLGEQQWQLPINELVQRWHEDFTILWKTPPGFSGLVRPGSRGKEVKWLADKLDIIQGKMVPPRTFTRMNILLTDRLRDFQLSTGLYPDGVAGPLTILRLNDATKSKAPRLNDRENS